MKRLTLALLAATALTATAQTGKNPAPAPAMAEAPKDTRRLVTLPEPVRAVMRADMNDHLMALNQVIGHLGRGELKEAGELAETRLGRSSMGRHRGMGPGRFMPTEMHVIGLTMHDVASEFARTAARGEARAAWAALEKVTSACVACHLSYRTY